MKRKIKFLIIVFGFAILFGLSYLLLDWYTMEHIVRYPTSFVYYDDTGVYKIDPSTILENIQENDFNVFTMPTNLESPYFSWKQKDFLEVVNALNYYVWNDDLTNWRLFYAGFSLNCQDKEKDFISGVFTYFQTPNIFSSYYVTRRFGVYPSSELVEWGGNGNFPRPPLFLGWSSIDIEKLKISGDEAFEIAEGKGGNDFREKNKNICTIHVSISPYMNKEVNETWHIVYDTDYSERLEILVDANSGEVYISE